MIVTFWSEDRVHTDVLVRTASWLARWGYTTLCVDWDMGTRSLTRALRQESVPQGVTTFVASHVRGRPMIPDRYVRRASLPDGGSVDLLPAGTGDRPHSHDDWQHAYRDRGLADTLEGCYVQWRGRYDVTLINTPPYNDGSRGITLAHLPDVVIPVYTPETVGAMVESLHRVDQARDRLPYGRGRLVVVPCGLGRADDAAELFEPWLRAWVSREVAPADVVAALRSSHLTSPRLGRLLAALLARGMAGTANVLEPSYVDAAATARVRRSPVLRRRPFSRAPKVPKEWLLDLALAAITRTAPDELPVFDVIAPAYADDPQRMFDRRGSGRDAVLGFGVDIDPRLLTPAVLYIAYRLLEAASPRWSFDRLPPLSKDQRYVARDAGLGAASAVGLDPELAAAIVDTMLERLPRVLPDSGEEAAVTEHPEGEHGEPGRGEDGG